MYSNESSVLFFLLGNKISCYQHKRTSYRQEFGNTIHEYLEEECSVMVMNIEWLNELSTLRCLI